QVRAGSAFVSRASVAANAAGSGTALRSQRQGRIAAQRTRALLAEIAGAAGLDTRRMGSVGMVASLSPRSGAKGKSRRVEQADGRAATGIAGVGRGTTAGTRIAQERRRRRDGIPRGTNRKRSASGSAGAGGFGGGRR